MKAIEILENVCFLPGFPWGADMFFGRNLWDHAQETKAEFIDVTNHFDPCKRYFVVWDRVCFYEFREQMPPHDLMIIKGDCKKFAWEIKND